jgi:hypothetical protein
VTALARALRCNVSVTLIRMIAQISVQRLVMKAAGFARFLAVGTGLDLPENFIETSSYYILRRSGTARAKGYDLGLALGVTGQPSGPRRQWRIVRVARQRLAIGHARGDKVADRVIVDFSP